MVTLSPVPRAVLGLIRDAGLPVWRANRPTVVAWVVLDDGSERRILGAESTHPAIEALRSRARERGVPLRLPLLDLQDLSAVSFTDVWGGFEEGIVAASARYRADAAIDVREREPVLERAEVVPVADCR